MTKISDTPAPESADEATKAPAIIVRQTLRMLDAATSIELEELDSIDYASHFMAQASLPLTEPKGSSYTRKNGNLELTIMPVALDLEGNGVKTLCYPYGVYPRLALIWIISEAVRTGNPRVPLGRTINDFMTTLGLEGGGGARVKEIRRQLLALFRCTLQVTSTDKIDGLTRDRLLSMTITSEAELWTATSRSKRRRTAAVKRNTSAESWVELSPTFFAKLQNNGTVPLDRRAVHALSRYAFALDIYTWATWRVHVARGKDVRVAWTTLSKQFGADYKLTRQFKAAFLKNLETRVKLVYPTLEYSSTTAYLTLHGSPTAVAKRVPKRVISKS